MAHPCGPSSCSPIVLTISFPGSSLPTVKQQNSAENAPEEKLALVEIVHDIGANLKLFYSAWPRFSEYGKR